MRYGYFLDDFYCIPIEGIIVLDSEEETLMALRDISLGINDYKGAILNQKPLNIFFSNRIGIFVSHECQLQCIYCYYDSAALDKEKSRTLTNSQINYIVKKVFESQE